MFKAIKEFFNPTEKVRPTTVNRGWRNNMWVMDNELRKVGIIVKLGEVCEVHNVDLISGETTNIYHAPLTQLRQAKWLEIPEVRRGITKQAAEALGYGS